MCRTHQPEYEAIKSFTRLAVVCAGLREMFAKKAKKINSLRPKRIDTDMWWLRWSFFLFRDKALDVKVEWRQWERTVIYFDGDNDAQREENNRGISVN